MTDLHEITGSQSLALGALEAGVQLVTGYPGSPSTLVVDALLELVGSKSDTLAGRSPSIPIPGGQSEPGALRIEWASNEKSAFDMAFGASLGGIRALLCLKSVGLNVALDSLMVSNLAGGSGGFVVLVGDDPGGWGSQNEQDSRPLVAAAEIPLLEPTSPAEGQPVMREAFALSERYRVPVAVRITRALTTATTTKAQMPAKQPTPRTGTFERQPERYNVLPVRVVELHQRLQATARAVQAEFEASVFNQAVQAGPHGLIAAGQASDKLAGILARSAEPPLSILRLGTLNPLPEERLTSFMRPLDRVLVLEETAPYVEVQVQALAQRAGLALPIHGRLSGDLPGTGELLGPEMMAALSTLLPDWPWPSMEAATRAMPSRQPLCDDCPYIPTFEALLGVMERLGGRDRFVIAGETGCMVRSQLPPWEMLDLKYGLGSSIGLATGLARSGIEQRVIALAGDSALVHSGLMELIDAVQAGVRLTVVVLANETTALSGGQPHPGTARDAQGRPRQPVDLIALIEAAGAGTVRVVDPEDRIETEAALAAAITSDGLDVVIARRECPRLRD